MNYDDVVRDFAKRTRKNLRFIEQAQAEGVEVYEVTQLVNSLLGLLVFPKERYYNRIPELSLQELKESGWPEIQVTGDFKKHKDLRELMRFLRNSIAHCNIEFLADHYYKLHGLRVWNESGGVKNWEAELSFEDLRLIVDKFTVLILKEGK